MASQQRDKALRAQVVQLAAAADSRTGAGDAVTGLLLAMEAVHAAPSSAPRGFTAEAERALTHALQQQHEVAPLIGHTSRVLSVAFSPDGKRRAGLTMTMRVCGTPSGRQIAELWLGHRAAGNSGVLAGRQASGERVRRLSAAVGY
jgi:hypothetical protein